MSREAGNSEEVVREEEPKIVRLVTEGWGSCKECEGSLETRSQCSTVKAGSLSEWLSPMDEELDDEIIEEVDEREDVDGE